MNQKIETYIEELRQTVTVAGLNYEVMNEITHTWDRSTHAFNLGSRKATERMLNDLGELKQIRSKKSTQNL